MSQSNSDIDAHFYEEIYSLLIEIVEKKSIPLKIKKQKNFILRDIYDAWVISGGRVSGKVRNSVRQMIDILGDNQIKSINTKLQGKN